MIFALDLSGGRWAVVVMFIVAVALAALIIIDLERRK